MEITTHTTEEANSGQESVQSTRPADTSKPAKKAERKRTTAQPRKPARRSHVRSAKSTKKVTTRTKAKRVKPKTSKARGKGEIVVGMLKRAKGASVPDLMKATKWQAHTLRAFLSVQSKKQRWKLKRERRDGVTIYRIAG